MVPTLLKDYGIDRPELEITLLNQHYTSCYSAMVHSGFKLAWADPLTRGRQSSTLRGPRGLKLEEKMAPQKMSTIFSKITNPAILFKL